MCWFPVNSQAYISHLPPEFSVAVPYKEVRAALRENRALSRYICTPSHPYSYNLCFPGGQMTTDPILSSVVGPVERGYIVRVHSTLTWAQRSCCNMYTLHVSIRHWRNLTYISHNTLQQKSRHRLQGMRVMGLKQSICILCTSSAVI